MVTIEVTKVILDRMSEHYDKLFSDWMQLIDDIEDGRVEVHVDAPYHRKLRKILISVYRKNNNYYTYVQMSKRNVTTYLSTLYKEIPEKSYQNVNREQLYKLWGVQLTAIHQRPIVLEVGSEYIVFKTNFTTSKEVCDMATLITLIHTDEPDFVAMRKNENVYHLLLKEENIDTDIVVEIQALINEYKEMNKDYSIEEIIAVAEQVIAENDLTLIPYTNYKFFF